MSRAARGRERGAPKSPGRTVRIPPPPLAPATPLGGRSLAAVVVALVLLWVALFAPTLGGSRAFVRGDAGQYSVFADYSRERFAETGARTHWNPYVFLGLPATASLADARPQWLPDPLLRAWDAATRTRAGAPLWPAQLACLLGALAAAVLVRELWGVGAPGMLLAGGAWLLAPSGLVPLAFGHEAQCITGALLPLTLWLAVRVPRDPAPAGAVLAALGFALSLSLQMLGGHPQYVVYTVLILVPLVGERALAHGRPARLVLLAGGAALAAAMSASVWWPALRFAQHAQRAEPAFAAREAVLWSLAPRDLLSLVWPRAVGYADAAYWGGMRGTDYSHVLGLLVCALAVAGGLARTPGRRLARVIGALAVAGMVLSLGRNLPVVGAFVQSLPVIGSFRTPMTWLWLSVFAGTLLAARGLGLVLATEPRAWWPRAGLTAAAFGMLVLLGSGPVGDAWLTVSRPAVEQRIARGLVSRPAFERFAAAAPAAARAAARDLGLQLALAGSALAGVGFARRRGAPVTLTGAALAALALVPLASLSFPALAAATGPRSMLAAPEPPPLAVAGIASSRQRVAWLDREWALSQRWSLSNRWVAWRARQPAGVSGAVPVWWDRAAREQLFGIREFLRACAVGTVALPDGKGGDTLSAWRDALPRAYSVRRVRSCPDDATVAASMREPGWDAAEVAYVVGGADQDFPEGAALRLDWRRDEPDLVELRTRSTGPAFLILADALFPGWTARVDGHSVPIERADLVLRGVRLATGEHTLVFAYAPQGWAAARSGTLAAWALFLVIAVVSGARSRRDRAPLTPVVADA